MRTAIQHTAVFFLVVLLILASGGFSIYEHFCRCAGQTKASLFIETSCNHHKASPASTCLLHKDNPSCCAEKKTLPDRSTSTHDNCCQDKEIFLKISDYFTPSWKKIPVKTGITLAKILPVIYGLTCEAQTYSHTLTPFNDTSPPLSGREWVILHHQLKLGYFLV